MTSIVQDRYPEIVHTFQAFILADVLIRDPGHGHILEITFDDGHTCRARVSAQMLRLRPRPNGRLRASFRFRTNVEATLQEPLHLYRVRPIAAPLNPPNGTFWAASGLAAADPHALVIIPEHTRTLPFKIHYQPQQDNTLPYPARNSLFVAGVVEQGRLLATNSRVCASMEIPPRWRIWEKWL